MQRQPIRIAGAGLSGLSAAIALARSGCEVDVFERRGDSGRTRQTDWDAVESWTTEDDLSHCLREWGLTTEFEHRAPLEFEVVDAAGECHTIRMPKPLFYLIKRGPEGGSLEQALKSQALEAGIRLHYSSPRARQDVDIWAAGASSAGFFLGAGLTFHTSHPDAIMCLVDKRIAPKAYAYLVIVDGFGTLSVVLTQDFKSAPAYLERCVTAFRRHKSFSMDHIHRASGFGGLVSAFWQRDRRGAGPLVVGEAGGFQDFLWGFGIRHALHTGQLAALALTTGADYEQLLSRNIRPLVLASIANRMLYDLSDNRIFRFLTRRFAASPNLPRSVRRWYAGPPLHRLLWPLAELRYHSV